MSDLLDDLRRYGAAVEDAVPRRAPIEVDASPRPPGRGRRALVAVAAAAVVVVLLGVVVWSSGDAADTPAVETVDRAAAADQAPDAAPDPVLGATWSVRSLGLSDGARWGGPVWFGGWWWENGVGTTQLSRSVDGTTWESIEHPAGPATLQSSELVVHDGRLLVAGIDLDGNVTAAVTDDGTEWTTSSVIEAGDGEFTPAGVTAVAFADGFGLATSSPTQASPDDLDRIDRDLGLLLSPDGIAWTPRALPAELDEAVAWYRVGPMLVASGEVNIRTYQPELTIITTDGVEWETVEIPVATSELFLGRSGLWWLGQSTQPTTRAPAVGEAFEVVDADRAFAAAESGEVVAVLLDQTPPDPSEQADLDAQWGWAIVEFTWTNGDFTYEGSLAGGGTLSAADGRQWSITYDDMIGTGDKIVLDGTTRRFVDPATGETLVVIDDEFGVAIADQYPEYAGPLAGEPYVDPTPAPDRVVVVRLFSLDGTVIADLTLPPFVANAHVSVAPGPDGSFLVQGWTAVEPVDHGFRVTEQSAFALDPPATE